MIKSVIAQAMRRVASWLWYSFVVPNYDGSSMSNPVFDTLWNITGWLELQADILDA